MDYGPQDFAAALSVPAPVLEKLERYAATLIQWRARMNLVGRSTLPELWQRHMLDSAQLVELIPSGVRTAVDLGSGAGFPGLVVAIIAAPTHPALRLHLIESDRRRAAFLAQVIGDTGAPAEVHAVAIEKAPALAPEIIMARACAPLSRLLSYAARFWQPHTTGLFLKGQDVEEELTEARKSWRLDFELIPSRSHTSGKILKVSGLEPI